MRGAGPLRRRARTRARGPRGPVPRAWGGPCPSRRPGGRHLLQICGLGRWLVVRELVVRLWLVGMNWPMSRLVRAYVFVHQDNSLYCR